MLDNDEMVPELLKAIGAIPKGFSTVKTEPLSALRFWIVVSVALKVYLTSSTLLSRRTFPKDPTTVGPMCLCKVKTPHKA